MTVVHIMSNAPCVTYFAFAQSRRTSVSVMSLHCRNSSTWLDGDKWLALTHGRRASTYRSRSAMPAMRSVRATKCPLSPSLRNYAIPFIGGRSAGACSHEDVREWLSWHQPPMTYQPSQWGRRSSPQPGRGRQRQQVPPQLPQQPRYPPCPVHHQLLINSIKITLSQRRPWCRRRGHGRSTDRA